MASDKNTKLLRFTLIFFSPAPQRGAAGWRRRRGGVCGRKNTDTRNVTYFWKGEKCAYTPLYFLRCGSTRLRAESKLEKNLTNAQTLYTLTSGWVCADKLEEKIIKAIQMEARRRRKNISRGDAKVGNYICSVVSSIYTEIGRHDVLLWKQRRPKLAN